MALRYVSPSGKTPPGYDAYYTNVWAALKAVVSGDTVVLEKSKDHYWPATDNISMTDKSFTMRNEDDDGDFENCCVTLENNACLRFVAPTSAVNVLIKGVTLQGPEGGYSTFRVSVSGSPSILFFLLSVTSSSVTLDSVRWRRLKWNGTDYGYDNRGLAFSVDSDGAGSQVNVTIRNCVFEDLQSPPTDSAWPRSWCLRYVSNALFENCRFENNGKADRSSAMQGKIGHAGTNPKDSVVVFKNCYWKDCYCLFQNLFDVEPPDGSAVCSPFSEAGDMVYMRFYDCIFDRCEAGKSGAVHAGRGSALYMERCYFKSCVARGTLGGGAVARGGVDSPLTAALEKHVLKSCIFDKCSAPNGYGGAVRSIANNSDVTVENCTFIDCTAKYSNSININKRSAVNNTNGLKIRNCAFYSSVGLGEQIKEGWPAGPFAVDEITNCASVNGDADFLVTQVTPVNTQTINSPLPLPSSPLIDAGADLGYVRDIHKVQGKEFIGALCPARMFKP